MVEYPNDTGCMSMQIKRHLPIVTSTAQLLYVYDWLLTALFLCKYVHLQLHTLKYIVRLCLFIEKFKILEPI